jgi:hypothetical protein
MGATRRARHADNPDFRARIALALVGTHSRWKAAAPTIRLPVIGVCSSDPRWRHVAGLGAANWVCSGGVIDVRLGACPSSMIHPLSTPRGRTTKPGGWERMLALPRRHALHKAAGTPLSRVGPRSSDGPRYQSYWPHKSSPCGLCYWTRECGSIPVARVSKARGRCQARRH